MGSYAVMNNDNGEILEPRFETAADARSFADNIRGDGNYSVIQVMQ